MHIAFADALGFQRDGQVAEQRLDHGQDAFVPALGSLFPRHGIGGGEFRHARRGTCGSQEAARFLADMRGDWNFLRIHMQAELI